MYIWHHDDADAKFYNSWDKTDCSVCLCLEFLIV
jgi:hypothetical protein